MRLVFAGTPEFARVALSALYQAGHEIVAVLTQPDRASGRGLSLAHSPVKQEALRLGLTVLQPTSLRDDKPGAQETKAALQTLAPDVMVVAAYGLLLPQEVLSIPRFGCLNIHASLLPRWRGAAPIQRAIAAGDTSTGIALMQMEAGLDTGPVWMKQEVPIHADDNFQTLHDRLTALGAAAIVELLKQFPPSGLEPVAQSESGVTYAHKITKKDLILDWEKNAHQVSAQARSLEPSPGAVASLQQETVKLFDVRAIDPPWGGPLLKNAVPGQIIKADREALAVACGEGAVSIGGLQRPGGKRVGFKEFLNGRPVTAGQIFESMKE